MSRSLSLFSPQSIIFILLISSVFADYYDILGVPKNATERDIHRAHKKLTFKYHPDRVKDLPKEQAEKRFADIVNAYEVLSDPEKRKIYDEKGEEAVRQGMGGPQNPADLIKQMLSGKPPNPLHSSKNQLQPGVDLPSVLELELEEIYSGTQIDFSVLHRVLCPKCGGSGAREEDGEDGLRECSKCNGKGVVIQQANTPLGLLNLNQVCPQCNGKGKIILNKCNKCKGDKTILKEEGVVCFIERGIKDGETIEYEDMGDANPETETGKLILTVREVKNKKFERRGDDLYTRVWISLRESLLGFTKNLTHLDNRTIKIERINQITPHNYILIIPNEGMPIKDDISSLDKRGNLFIQFSVFFPSSLNSTQISAISQIFDEKQVYSPPLPDSPPSLPPINNKTIIIETEGTINNNNNNKKK